MLPSEIELERESACVQEAADRARSVLDARSAVYKKSVRWLLKKTASEYVHYLSQNGEDLTSRCPSSEIRAHIYKLSREALAFLTIHTMLVKLLRRDTTIRKSTLYSIVGRMVEFEIFLNDLYSEHGKIHYYLRREFMGLGFVKKRKLIARLAKKTGYTFWTPEVARIVGAVLCESINDLFQFYIQAPGDTLSVTLDRSVENWIVSSELAHSVPRHLPMLSKPLDWEGFDSGGGYYHTKLRRERLVKTLKKKHNSYINDNIFWADPVRIVNTLQSIPFQINERVLDAARKTWALGHGAAGLPPMENDPKPRRPELKENYGEFLRWQLQVQLNERRNTIYKKQRERLIEVIHNASQCAGKDMFFPMFYCYRGRLYCEGGRFTYQGGDLSRAMIQFSRGKPILTKEHEDAFYLHGSGRFGLDKSPVPARRAWVESHRQQISLAARDPMGAGFGFWTQADEPFQFLAFCFEAEQYWRLGSAHISRMICWMDHTSSSIQVSALLCNHRRLAIATNLSAVRQDCRPADLYGFLGRLFARRLQSAGRPELDEFVKWMPAGLWRKLIKSSAMPLQFGGTKYAFRQALLFWLDEQFQSRGWPWRSMTDISRGYTALREELWAFVGRHFRDVLALQDALHAAAEQGLKSKQLTLKLPDGWIVCMDAPTLRSKSLEIAILESRFNLTPVVNFLRNNTDGARTLRGVFPNVVHAIDSALLRAIVLDCLDRGIENLAVIHDCYGALAHDMPTVLQRAREHYSNFLFTGLPDILEQLAGKRLRPGSNLCGRFQRREVHQSILVT